MPKPLPKKSTDAPLSIKGKVVGHNISPRGYIEGVLLETAKGRVQINLSKEAETHDLSARAFKIGAIVQHDVEIENDEDGDHVVYALAESSTPVHGRIERLNYARHGEVNGYHLDTGTFVHVKPDGHRKHKLGVGDDIAVEGGRRIQGAVTVIEPDSLAKTNRGTAKTARSRR